MFLYDQNGTLCVLLEGLLFKDNIEHEVMTQDYEQWSFEVASNKDKLSQLSQKISRAEKIKIFVKQTLLDKLNKDI